MRLQEHTVPSGRSAPLGGFLYLLLAGCTGPFVAEPPCVPAAGPVTLPSSVPESSGVEPAGEAAGSFWTHNDSGWDPILFQVDSFGTELGRVHVEGARNRDWEDLAAGPCPEGGRCLYIADTGDNALVRQDPAVYRVREPSAADETVTAQRFPVRFPHGPRDVEALHVLPGERLFFITKGRAGPVELYRYPGPPAEDEPVELERIQILTDRAPLLPSMVTGSAASPDGSLVAVRTYQALTFHLPDSAGLLEEVPGGTVNLRPLGEVQGEAVAFLSGDRLVLTSEAGPGGEVGSMAFLRCSLPGPSW